MGSAFYTTQYLDYLGSDIQIPETGAVFVYRPSKLKKYYYGVVVSNNVIHKTIPENRRLQLHFYNYCTEEIEKKPYLSFAPLLFPPILVHHTIKDKITYEFEKTAWLAGYFRVIGRIDLTKLPAVNRAMFVDWNGWLYNENGEAVEYKQLDKPDSYAFLGRYYEEGPKKLEEWLVFSLDLSEDKDKCKLLWYQDYFKSHQKELLLRQLKANLICSGKLIEVQTSYCMKKVKSLMLPEQIVPQYKRYIKQGGSEHYAVIQYQIKQRPGSYGLFFQSLASLEERYQENCHIKRMFQTFVVMVWEGIQEFADMQYKEKNIALGGMEICLLQLKLHESDSKLLDFKIAGAMILADHLKIYSNENKS